MNTHADKIQESNRRFGQQPDLHATSGPEATFQFVDRRPEVLVQQELQEMGDLSVHVQEAAQLQTIADTYTAQYQPLVEQNNNDTGLPDQLKVGIELLSGYSMDDVKVHHNSDKPAQLQAHAFAHGNDIHLGAGQEGYLPHEAWHVVQQKQGRVRPTFQMKGMVGINDDQGLEREADLMGAKAQQMGHVVQRQEAEPREFTDEEKKEIEELGGAVLQPKYKSGSPTGAVLQRAYTARRPLGGTLSVGSLEWSVFKNKGVFHEHIFFEDGKKPLDIGFHAGDNKLFQDDPGLLSGYVKIKTGLWDPTLREAVEKVGDPGRYSLLGNNCQAYVGKVLKEYEKIDSNPSGNPKIYDSIGNEDL